MSSLVIELCLLLLPMQADPVRAHAAMQAIATARSTAAVTADSSPTEAAGRKQFEERFNKVTEALADFSREYNKGKGQVWPKEKADALKKALEDLEKTEPRFRK